MTPDQNEGGALKGGWIEWNSPFSARSPVASDVIVEIRFRDERTEHHDKGPAGDFYWKSDGDCDIIAYREVGR